MELGLDGDTNGTVRHVTVSKKEKAEKAGATPIPQPEDQEGLRVHDHPPTNYIWGTPYTEIISVISVCGLFNFSWIG